MEKTIVTAIAVALALSAAMALAWHVALRSGRSGWIDAIWSFAVGAAGAVAALAPIDASATSPRQFLVAGMVALWSLRLGLHIAKRTAAGGDDPRYRHLREQWGGAHRSKLFVFLQIQAVAALVLAVASGAAAHRPAPGLGLQDWLGALILAAGIAGEGLADRQLAHFRRRPAPRGVCTIGLWGWSRHPNYFFEWLSWTGYLVIAADFTGGYPWGWAALGAPAMMYWLLVHVSGIPPLEAHMLRAHGDRFRSYQKTVNAFWPGPPRLASRNRRAETLP